MATFHRAKYLIPEDVKRVLKAYNRRTSTGRRDYAILLLLARLGFRAGEVVAFQIDDIDWRDGEIIIRGTGAGFEVSCPRCRGGVSVKTCAAFGVGNRGDTSPPNGCCWRLLAVNLLKREQLKKNPAKLVAVRQPQVVAGELVEKKEQREISPVECTERGRPVKGLALR